MYYIYYYILFKYFYGIYKNNISNVIVSIIYRYDIMEVNQTWPLLML